MTKVQARTFYYLMLISVFVTCANTTVIANLKRFPSDDHGANSDQKSLEVSSVVGNTSFDRENPNGFIGAKGESDEATSEEEKNSPSPPIHNTEETPHEPTEAPGDMSPWNRMTTERLILMGIISLGIPIGFMGLLFYRLRKEKKYMNARAGALVYTGTVLVPSYTVSNAQAPDSNGTLNMNQMYSTLYDTPPEYDAVVKPKTVLEKSEKPNLEVQTTNSEDIPPPAYSTVYI